ncbi:hypothetical protein LXA43DRAFT_1101387 [Ganoderma leucocontextum]|nr:hypothetical protein LXA43DRAFT_1101387 [Ganoderma leucocontextum]
MDAIAPNAHGSPPSSPDGIPSPCTYNTIPSLGRFTSSASLEDCSLYPWNSADWLTRVGRLTNTLPSSHALPMTSEPHNSDLHRFHPICTLSSNITVVLDGELVSSPTSIPQDLPPPPGEAGPMCLDSYLSSALPGFEARDVLQWALETSMYSSSGQANSIVRPLPQHKYMAMSQMQAWSEAIVDYERGYRLDKDKLGVAAIAGYNEVAFPRKTFAQKVSFRLEIEGYKPYTTQLNVRTTRGQPTKGRFAECTVDFMERFIVSIHDTPDTFAVRS